MVEGHANITVRGVTRCIRLSALELARIWCQQAGFDVDAEPTGTTPGQWRITARNGNSTVSKTGSLQEAATRLIEDMQ